MDQDYDRTKNRTIREGVVPMEHVSIGEDGIQRWGGGDIAAFEKWWATLVERSPMTMFIYHYDGDPGDEHVSRCCP